MPVLDLRCIEKDCKVFGYKQNCTHFSTSYAVRIGQITTHALRTMHKQYEEAVEGGQHEEWQHYKYHQCVHAPDVDVQSIIAQSGVFIGIESHLDGREQI